VKSESNESPLEFGEPAPSTLRDAQSVIAASLRGLRRIDKTPDASETARQLLTGNERLTPEETLEIYRRQFWLRHTSSLLEDYPGLSGILGQREWETLIESYLTTVPIDSWTLRDLGQDLAEHVAARPQTPHRALCTDMARLEWAYTELFDAAEPSPLDPNELAAIPEDAWPSARITLSPALRLLRVNYPVAQLRKRLRSAAQSASNSTSAIEIPDEKPHNLALYRDPTRVLRYESIGDAPFAILEALAEGERLSAACERAAERHPETKDDIEANVGAWFAHWGSRRWVVDVVV